MVGNHQLTDIAHVEDNTDTGDVYVELRLTENVAANCRMLVPGSSLICSSICSYKSVVQAALNLPRPTTCNPKHPIPSSRLNTTLND